MIYRITVWDGRRSGISWDFDKEMLEMGIRVPRAKINPKARFYFTDLGWKMVGRKLVSLATKRGLYPKVERHKNPKSSDIVYRDPFQVAVLPRKRK